MTFKRFKEYKLIKFITNRYVLILIVFSVWMLFFDENSYLVHRKFNTEIEKLETGNSFFERNIKKDKNHNNATRLSSAREICKRAISNEKRERRHLYY